MKRFFALLLCALMAVSMIASASAASIKPDKEYADAKDGDLLYTANFKDAAYDVFTSANTATYTVSADGTSFTVENKDDKDTADYWGVKLESLGAANGEKYTITYKVKANGTIGKNNSVGVGGLWSGASDTKFYTAYGNHNTVDANGSTADRRISISLAGSKVGEYNNDVKNPDIDKDGFVSMKQEIDTAAKKIRAYTMIDGKWSMTLDKSLTDFVADKACMSFVIYSWYTVVDTTVKDFKIYRGVDLTDAQLNPAPETTAPVTTAAPTTVPAAPSTPSAPATFDASVLLAVAVSLSAAGVVIGKKRK